MRPQTAWGFGWPIVIVLSSIPLILWGMMYALPDRFGSASNLMTSVGQSLGLVGFAMFSFNLFLGARFKWIEKVFGGMNKVYIAHHILGGLAFVFLLLHPLFLVLRYLAAGAGGDVVIRLFFWPVSCGMGELISFSPECAINYGILGLGSMIVTLYITFFLHLPYQVWKFTHKFLGLVYFFAILHVLMIPSDVSIDALLRGYLWFLIALGSFSIVYRTVLGFLLVPRLLYVVKEVRRQGQAIVEIVLTPQNKKKMMKYRPGQFLFINFPKHKGLEEVHPFSITSNASEDELSIGIKSLGDFTKETLNVVPGDMARVEGPFGRMSYGYYPNHNQVWIAGGIGITPFLGMARTLKATDPYEIDLYYSLVDRSETAFVAELQQIANEKPNLRFYPHYAKEAGYLTAETVKKQSGPLSEKDIFLCGPPPMMAAFKKQFAAYHLSPKTIHSEEFTLQ